MIRIMIVITLLALACACDRQMELARFKSNLEMMRACPAGVDSLSLDSSLWFDYRNAQTEVISRDGLETICRSCHEKRALSALETARGASSDEGRKEALLLFARLARASGRTLDSYALSAEERSAFPSDSGIIFLGGEVFVPQ